MAASTHILVANPSAQSGRNAARIDRALRAFETHGIHAELLPTLPEGQTIAAVREALDNGVCQCVVSMGGDGTLREVAQALYESGRKDDVTLAMLPAGTANNHGRSFGLSLEDKALEHNVAIVAQGHETRLDLGRLVLLIATGQTVAQAIFVDSVGFGIGARVIARRHAERRRFGEETLLGKVYRDLRVYTVATVQSLWLAEERDAFGVTMEVDGETSTFPHLTELLIKGTRVYAGSWVVDRNSQHDDGLFEMVAYENNRLWVPKGLLAVVDNAKFEQAVDAMGLHVPASARGSKWTMRFHPSGGLSLPAVQVDGELFPSADRAEIEVIPRAVRLVVP